MISFTEQTQTILKFICNHKRHKIPMCSWDKKQSFRYYVRRPFYFIFYFFKPFILYSCLADYQLCDSFRWIAKGRVSILFQSFRLSILPDSTEQSFMCYTVGSCWLYILNIEMCTCLSQTPCYFPHSPSWEPYMPDFELYYKAAVIILRVIWTLTILLSLYFKLYTKFFKWMVYYL